MTEDAEQRVDEGKQVAYYQACLGAWVNTRMERDKTLLALSAGGVGVLVSLLTAVGVSSVFGLAMYFVPLSLFVATILVCIRILEENAEYLENVINEGAKGHSNKLRRLDHWAKSFFIIAVMMSAILALSIAGQQILTEENQSMNDERREERLVPSEEIKKESLDGIGNLGPGKLENIPQPQGTPSAQSSGQQPQPSPDTSVKDVSGSKK